MSELKYDVAKFVDEEFELSVNVSPKEEGELDENRTRAKNARHLEDGRIFKVDVYNLDVIIAVGYRVNSKRGTLFRQCANKVLKEYLLTGYVINKERSLVTNENYVRLINKVESLELDVILNGVELIEVANGRNI